MKKGEIFFAHVRRIFPNQHAEIQLGNHKLIARLEAPLESGKGYFLQVESDEGEPRLKLIDTNPTGKFSFLRSLSLPIDKGYHLLAEYFTRESISLTPEQIQKAGKWIGSAPDKNLALEAIQLMRERNMPFSEAVFSTLLAAGRKIPMTDMISSLRTALFSEKEPDPSVQKIITLIDGWGTETVKQRRREEQWFQGKYAMARIKHVIQQIGLFHENSIIHNRDGAELDSLKSLIIKYLGSTAAKTNPIARQVAEHLLHRMNGQQLMSIESGPVQQLFFDLPIELNGHRTDISFQWEGKRRKDGKIDPDYCRVIFYLDLENLGKVVVDVKIQNRITNIIIITESAEIKAIAANLIPELKEKLKEHHYELSDIHFKQPGSQEAAPLKNIGTKSYSGVDIQI